MRQLHTRVCCRLWNKRHFLDLFQVPYKDANIFDSDKTSTTLYSHCLSLSLVSTVQRTLIGCISKLTSGPVRFSITVSSKCLFIFVKSFRIMIYIILKKMYGYSGLLWKKIFCVSDRIFVAFWRATRCDSARCWRRGSGCRRLAVKEWVCPSASWRHAGESCTRRWNTNASTQAGSGS